MHLHLFLAHLALTHTIASRLGYRGAPLGQVNKNGDGGLGLNSMRTDGVGTNSMDHSAALGQNSTHNRMRRYQDFFEWSKGLAGQGRLDKYTAFMRTVDHMTRITDVHIDACIELQMACLASSIYTFHPSNASSTEQCSGDGWPPPMLYSFSVHNDETERLQLYENADDNENGNWCAMVWVGTNNLHKIFTDLNVIKVDFCGYEMHAGFRRQYEKFTKYNDGREWNEMMRLWAQCKAKGRRLVTTGHSLGAAAAAVFAACSMYQPSIIEVDELHTLGLPAPTNPPLSKHGKIFPGVRFVQTNRVLGSTYYDLVPVLSRLVDGRKIQKTLGVVFPNDFVGMQFPEQDAVMVGWAGALPPSDFDLDSYRFTRFSTECLDGDARCYNRDITEDHERKPEECKLTKDTPGSRSSRGCDDPANFLPRKMARSNIMLHPYFFYADSIKAWCHNGKRFNGPDGTLSDIDAVLTGHSPHFDDIGYRGTRRRSGGPVHKKSLFTKHIWKTYT